MSSNLDILKEDIYNGWNPSRFDIVRFPESLGFVPENLRKDFDKNIRCVLDMPIKIPGSEIKIPSDLKSVSIMHVIGKCYDYEKSINPNIDDYYIYLTIHHSEVKKGESQRRLGAHIDGMQGERYKDKLPVCHSYLVSNIIPTRFFNHKFPTNLCEKTQNWFYEFDKLKDYNFSCLSKPYEINMMTAYNVHESTVSEEEGVRTFIRLEFSLKKFDRIGNTINEELNLDWNYVDRAIPKHLKVEIFD